MCVRRIRCARNKCRYRPARKLPATAPSRGPPFPVLILHVATTSLRAAHPPCRCQVPTTRYGEYHIALLGGWKSWSQLDGTCGARQKHRKLCRSGSLVSVIPCVLWFLVVKLFDVSPGYKWPRKGLLFRLIADWIKVTKNGNGCTISTTLSYSCHVASSHDQWVVCRFPMRRMHRARLNSFAPTSASSMDVCISHPTEAHRAPFQATHQRSFERPKGHNWAMVTRGYLSPTSPEA